MNKKTIIVVAILVIIILLIFLKIVGGKKENNSNIYTSQDGKLIMEYNDETGNYIIRDEVTNEIKAESRDESELKIYLDNPDYFEGFSDNREEMILDTADLETNFEE